MKKIHILEDNEDITQLMRILLKDQYLVATSATAYEFWQHLNNDTADIVLLDVRIPDGDGVEICKELKSRYPDLPVMLISAHLNFEEDDYGADACLAKPFDIEDFRRKVDRMVSLKNI